jgi:AcrR family transcriptional regulator
MRRPSGTSCKNRILDAAERAFGDFGFAGASLRRIVLAAGVNLATVYYYFGSKEGLLAAVFKRRFGPLRQEHFQVLRQAEAAAADRAWPVEKLIESMILPSLRLAAQTSMDSVAVRRLIGRIVTDPNPRTQELVRSQSADVRAAYFAAFRHSLPGISEAELHWGLEFLWGALAFILCNPRKMERVTGGVCNPLDTPTVVAQMIAFFTPGFRCSGTFRRKKQGCAKPRDRRFLKSPKT